MRSFIVRGLCDPQALQLAHTFLCRTATLRVTTAAGNGAPARERECARVALARHTTNAASRAQRPAAIVSLALHFSHSTSLTPAQLPHLCAPLAVGKVGPAGRVHPALGARAAPRQGQRRARAVRASVEGRVREARLPQAHRRPQAGARAGAAPLQKPGRGVSCAARRRAPLPVSALSVSRITRNGLRILTTPTM